MQLASLHTAPDEHDFETGLEIIENRAESLNRFLQAYRQLMGLPAPKLELVSVAAMVKRIAHLETRLTVNVSEAEDITLLLDPDHIQQALINLLRNAAEAALSPDVQAQEVPRVDICWERAGAELVIAIHDNGPGLMNEGNLFVPFYTTKPGGTGIGLVLTQQIARHTEASSTSSIAPMDSAAAGPICDCHSLHSSANTSQPEKLFALSANSFERDTVAIARLELLSVFDRCKSVLALCSLQPCPLTLDWKMH